MVKHKENNRTFIHSIPSWITKKQKCGHFYEFVELVDKPSSVVDNHSSRRQITLPLKQPTRTLDGPSIEFLFGLATSGVYLAARCYQRHGVLLPHPFTLPFSRRSALCCTGRRLTPPGRYPALCPL